MNPARSSIQSNFPSFSEGLSLRHAAVVAHMAQLRFPFLFGGTFIEASGKAPNSAADYLFPFLFGGTFIEAQNGRGATSTYNISLPFRRDFH